LSWRRARGEEEEEEGGGKKAKEDSEENKDCANVRRLHIISASVGRTAKAGL